jgi:hypothetical protein
MSNTTANANAAAAPAASETPAHLVNDKRHADLMKQVRTFGSDSGAGRDSLPKLAHAVVKAAADGVIDLETKNKKGEDSATQIYMAYAEADSKKSIHEHKDAGVKANSSKLRQLIKLGCMTTIDPVALMQEAHEIREGLKHDEGTKLKPAYHFYVDLARNQVEKDKKLSKGSIEDLAVKGEAAPKELIDRLKQIDKLLEGLVTGENRDKLKDSDELTEAAAQAIKERLKKMELAQYTAKLRADAAKLGLTLA